MTHRAMRRFPAPWKIEPLDGGGFKIMDSNKQALAYVYGHVDSRDAEIAKGLTPDEGAAHSEQHRKAAKPSSKWQISFLTPRLAGR